MDTFCKWIHGHQISCPSHSPWWLYSLLRMTARAVHSDQQQVQVTEHHWRQLSLRSPFTLYLSTNEKPRLVIPKRDTIKLVQNCLLRPKTDSYILPCFGSFHCKCLPSFPFLRFFLLLALLFVQTYRWVDECIVLLLLTCLRLYGLAVSMFGGIKDGGTDSLVSKRIR